MTHALITDPDRSAETAADEGDDLESELFLSAREAGVTCYLIPGAEAGEGTAGAS